MSITTEKAARCFAVRVTTPLATSRAESGERSSVILDGKANTAQSVSSVAGLMLKAYLSRESCSKGNTICDDKIWHKIIYHCVEVLLAARIQSNSKQSR